MSRGKAILSILAGVVLLAPFTGWSRGPEPEPLRPAATAFTVEIGRQSALDTYLSPVRYGGLSLALGYERLRATSFAPGQWLTRHAVTGTFASMTNTSGNGSMLSGYLDYSFAMLRRWQVCKGLWLAGGGEASLTLGGLYNLRNSNNPGSAKAAVDLGVTAMASYHFRIKRLPVTLRYQGSLPVIGAFFSPEFGQSYYEMFYIGNRDGMVHLGAWHNRVDLRNYISVDLHLGTRALRLGYRQVMRTTHLYHIDTQVFTHAFVLGISGEIFRSVRPARRIVSVYH